MKMAQQESKVHEFRHMLGKYPDREVAKAAGVSSSTVFHYRHRRNIPPHRGGFNRMSDSGQAAIKKRKRCACGGAAIEKFRGEYMCSECLVPDYPIELNPYSGISPTDCRR